MSVSVCGFTELRDFLCVFLLNSSTYQITSIANILPSNGKGEITTIYEQLRMKTVILCKYNVHFPERCVHVPCSQTVWVRVDFFLSSLSVFFYNSFIRVSLTQTDSRVVYQLHYKCDMWWRKLCPNSLSLDGSGKNITQILPCFKFIKLFLLNFTQHNLDDFVFI